MIKKIFYIIYTTLCVSCSLFAVPETLVNCKTDADCQAFVASKANVYRKCNGKSDKPKCITKSIGLGPIVRDISYCACDFSPVNQEPLYKVSDCASAGCADVSRLSGAQPLCDKDAAGVC